MQARKYSVTAHWDNANLQNGFATGKRMDSRIKLIEMFHKLLSAFQQNLPFFGNNYIVVIDKKNLIVYITNIETIRTFDRKVKDLIDIVVNPIKLSVLLKANGSKFTELKRKFDEQIKLSNVAKYVYKEIQ